jgi:hypothetical protein
MFNPFRQIHTNPFGNSFNRHGTVSKPPSYDSLLLWAPDKLNNAGAEVVDKVGGHGVELCQAPCMTMDGSSDYLSGSWFSGTSTVTNEGTATPTVSSGRIDFTSGTVYNLVVAGETFPCIESGQSYIFSESGKRLDINTSDLSTLWASTQDDYFYEAEHGYSIYEQILKYSNLLTKTTTWSSSLVVAPELVDGWWKITHDTSGFLGCRTGYEESDWSGDFAFTTVAPDNTLPRCDQQKQYIYLYKDEDGDLFYFCFWSYTEGSIAQWQEIRTTVSNQSWVPGTICYFGKPTTSAVYYVKDIQFGRFDHSVLPTHGNVVILGDSTSLHHASFLQNMFTADTMIEAAVGGDTIQDMIDRFQTDVADKNPDVIVVTAGTNSITSDPLSKLETDMRSLLDLCDATGAAVITSETLPNNNFTDAQADKQSDFHDWIESQGYQHIKLFDYFLETGTTHTLIESFSNLGVHLDIRNAWTFHSFIIAKALGWKYPTYKETEDAIFLRDYHQPITSHTYPGGRWNNANCKYKLKEVSVLITQDALEGNFFFDGSGNAQAKTQAEIVTYVSGKTATFFKDAKGRGLGLYAAKQTGSALTKIQAWFL